MTDTETGAPPTMQGGGMRDFIEAVLREQRGNAVIARVGGRLPNGRPKVNRPKWFRYPEQLDQMVTYAEAYRMEDLYLSPIVYGEKKDEHDEPSRGADNALTSQTVYMDSDACPPSAFRLKPSIHVDTSPGRGHDYWVLPEPIPASEAAALAHKIAIAHRKDGTDPSGWSASKYLRLPTVNKSYGDPVAVVWHDTGELYSDLDIAGAYDDVQIDALPIARPEPSAPAAPAAGKSTERPPLIPKEDLAPLYDRIPASSFKLIDLLEHKPAVGEKGWRSEQRWALLLELARAGFSHQEAMSLAWHAAASGKWWDDPRGLDGLWYEIQRARLIVDGESGIGIEPPPSRQETRAPKLLQPKEAKRALARRGFIDEYVDWAASRVAVLNRPLHEMNAWTVLSAAYAPTGYVWKATDPLRLNLYSMSVSPSSSGKSEASRMMRRAINRLYPHDQVLIGADHSRNNLIGVLNERDGMISVAQSDEGDETLATQSAATWAQGMQQAWTEVYDGEVPQQGRISDKGPKKGRATALVLLHMVGTPDGVYATVDRQMFKSGYLARFVWVEGVKQPVTRESIALRGRDDERPGQNDHDLFPRYWQSQVAINRRRTMNLADPKPVPVDFTKEATERLNDARFAIVKGLDKIGDESILSPIANRMLDILLKACALVALGDGRTVVTLPDALRAIEQCQRWLEAVVRVTDKIAASAFSRACDEVEAFIAGREAKETQASSIYSFMRGYRVRDVDEYLQSLALQGRIEAINPNAGGPRRFKIKDRPA